MGGCRDGMDGMDGRDGMGWMQYEEENYPDNPVMQE